ncbi:hypothetical protein, partial [Bradyrhizobium sp. 142]
GVSLSLRGSGRLDTRLDTPPISFRHHPLSCIARKPNGSTFAVNSTIRVEGNTATLTYRLSDNDPESIWPGVTRIVFETAERKIARRIEWQDDGIETFVVPDPPPVWREYYEQNEDQRAFVIKTDLVGAKWQTALSSHAPGRKNAG